MNGALARLPLCERPGVSLKKSVRLKFFWFIKGANCNLCSNHQSFAHNRPFFNFRWVRLRASPLHALRALGAVVHEQLTIPPLIFIGAFYAFSFGILNTLQSSEAVGHRILTQWATT
tara:strand:- start:8130 stop:8480 length:351 start_codon:yes stop_codon:yes gene_type:complete